MLPELVLNWGKTRSCIRELMEYGVKRKMEIGKDNVFDFSLGNPSIPSPAIVNQTIIDLVSRDDVMLHGYTTAAGNLSLRKKLADDLKARYNLPVDEKLMYVTCGAAASLSISLHSLLLDEDEVIVMAPFFPEYRVFIRKAGGKTVVCPPDERMYPDLNELRKLINVNTRAVVINSPNNPTGAVYDEECIKELCSILKEAEKTYEHSIYLICDEPYRELIFDDVAYVSPLHHYDNAIICYSFSKSMSLAGERLGYIALSTKMNEVEKVYACVMGAGRSMGYVNAPALFQRVVEETLGAYSNFEIYKKNRDLLCENLKSLGYEYIYPQGAFYLFVKALEKDAKAFSERAKKYELLLVPSDDFGIQGYVRIAYCLDESVIRNSYASFAALKKEYDHE